MRIELLCGSDGKATACNAGEQGLIPEADRLLTPFTEFWTKGSVRPMIFSNRFPNNAYASSQAPHS